VSSVAPLLVALALALVPQQSPAAADDCAGLTGRFLERLAAWREGEASTAGELRELAQALCSDCGRCDALDVASYYLGLSPQARRSGLDAEARFAELYAAVQEAGRSGVAGDAWKVERERLLGELRELAARSGAEPDYVPAARALSLAARLEVEALELDPELDAPRQAELAGRAGADAREALELFERAGLLTPRLEPVWLDARLALAGRRFAEARRGFQQVLALAERVGNLDYREHGLRGLAQLARAAGDARGEDRLLVELASFRDPRESWPLARDWAARLLAEDHAEEALDFLERYEPSPNAHQLDRLEWHLSMGAALTRLGETPDARAHLERAASGTPSETAVLALAQLALEEGRGFEVRDLLDDPERRAGFSARGQAEALRLLGEDSLDAGQPEQAVVELDEALRKAERWRAALGPRLGTGAAGALGPGGVESVFGEWAGLHTLALYAEAQRRCGRPLEALRRIVEDHSRSLREARAAPATLQALAAGEDPGAISPADLGAWVGRNELGLVAWVVGADFGVVVHAWVEEGELHARAAPIPRGRSAMTDVARRLREAAVSGDPARLAREAADARSAVLPDVIADGLVERAGALGGRARLLLLVHGPLERLPFELLPLGTSGRTLDELCVPLALPGLPDATPPRAPDAHALEAWSLLGPPPPLAGWPSLPGAAEEIDELARLRPGAVHVGGENLTADALGDALASGRALHVATHLVAGGLEGGPALLLANGERADADFVRAHAGALPLVVLSACETGGGAFVDAQGLQGLARAFLETGTRDLVVTLWPVRDDAARRFAVALHRALLAGETPARAAGAAREALREAGLPPAEWAAFRLLGLE